MGVFWDINVLKITKEKREENTQTLFFLCLYVITILEVIDLCKQWPRVKPLCGYIYRYFLYMHTVISCIRYEYAYVYIVYIAEVMEKLI